MDSSLLTNAATAKTLGGLMSVVQHSDNYICKNHWGFTCVPNAMRVGKNHVRNAPALCRFIPDQEPVRGKKKVPFCIDDRIHNAPPTKGKTVFWPERAVKESTPFR
jgi:hypothetical protein